MAGMMEWGGRSGRYYRTMLLGEREENIDMRNSFVSYLYSFR